MSDAVRFIPVNTECHDAYDAFKHHSAALDGARKNARKMGTQLAGCSEDEDEAFARQTG